CLMHDWKICLHDGNVQEPESECVDTYEEYVEGDLLYLLIEE
ncbi:nitrite reductase (NAD(P)H) small subunit, partial [Priestia megaterium]